MLCCYRVLLIATLLISLSSSLTLPTTKAKVGENSDVGKEKNSINGRRGFFLTSVLMVATTSAVVIPSSSLAHEAMTISDYTTSIYDLYSDDCKTDCVLNCELLSSRLLGNNDDNECERKCVRIGRRYCQGKRSTRYVFTTSEIQLAPAKKIPGLRPRWRDDL
mmetsp:Transcript_41870/g.42740  ORF Transcript_41870/g.42740 Transcript_41870/m.42740 type:complete len:163 (-) Transcript_41870:62-550(-)